MSLSLFNTPSGTLRRKKHFNILKMTLLSSSLNWSYLFHIKATQKSQISTKLKGIGSILHKYGSFSNSITAQLSVKHSLTDNWAQTLHNLYNGPRFIFVCIQRWKEEKTKWDFQDRNKKNNHCPQLCYKIAK